MRIGIISDIHCNVAALRMGLELMRPVDLLLCAGDMVLQYRFSNETMNILRTNNVCAVMGNHEDAVLSPACAPLRASGTVDPDHLRYLEQLPHVVKMDIEGKRLVLAHTTALDPTNDYPFHLEDRPKQLAGLKADVLIVGNTHRPTIANVGSTLFINPGALGDSRGPDPWERTYAVLDTETWEARIHNFRDPAAHRYANGGGR